MFNKNNKKQQETLLNIALTLEDILEFLKTSDEEKKMQNLTNDTKDKNEKE